MELRDEILIQILKNQTLLMKDKLPTGDRWCAPDYAMDKEISASEDLLAVSDDLDDEYTQSMCELDETKVCLGHDLCGDC